MGFLILVFCVIVAIGTLAKGEVWEAFIFILGIVMTVVFPPLGILILGYHIRQASKYNQEKKKEKEQKDA